MSSDFDLDPVSRITAGAVGEPGQRVFYLQARKDSLLVTLLAEKQQVQLLANSLSQLLEAMGGAAGEGDEPSAEDLELEQPLLPEWRVGPMEIAVDEDRVMIILLVQEAVDEDEERDPAEARFVASPAQMRALAQHADEVCAAGRPRCQMCGFPIEPEGHACPAQNGHRKLSEP